MYHNVTSIENLMMDQVEPEIQQREHSASRHIRNNHNGMPNSGFGGALQYSNPKNSYTRYAANMQEGGGFNPNPEAGYVRDLAGAYGNNTNFIEGYNDQAPVNISGGPVSPMASMADPSQSGGPSSACVDVLHHCRGCPVCSKFYNNDNTLYLVIIAILAIFCIILLKRVLNV